MIRTSPAKLTAIFYFVLERDAATTALLAEWGAGRCWPGPGRRTRCRLAGHSGGAVHSKVNADGGRPGGVRRRGGAAGKLAMEGLDKGIRRVGGRIAGAGEWSPGFHNTPLVHSRSPPRRHFARRHTAFARLHSTRRAPRQRVGFPRVVRALLRAC